MEALPEVPVKYEVKKLELEIDTKTFKPCNPKLVSIWRWGKMRTEKLVVHLDEDLKLTIRRIESE